MTVLDYFQFPPDDRAHWLESIAELLTLHSSQITIRLTGPDILRVKMARGNDWFTDQTFTGDESFLLLSATSELGALVLHAAPPGKKDYQYVILPESKARDLDFTTGSDNGGSVGLNLYNTVQHLLARPSSAKKGAPNWRQVIENKIAGLQKKTVMESIKSHEEFGSW
jgi:hypothetical protein